MPLTSAIMKGKINSEFVYKLHAYAFMKENTK